MKKTILLSFALTIFSALSVFSQPGCGDTNLGTISPNACTSTNANYTSGTIPYWSFNAQAGYTYHFTLGANTEDSYLRLYDASYSLVASIDDYGPFVNGAPASLSWTCVTAGTYYISAARYSCNTFFNSSYMVYWSTNGTYGATSGNTLTTTTAWQNQPYSNGNMYWYRFNATAATEYQFSLCSNTEDSFIQIYNSNWSFQISADDNGPHCSGLPASINWTAPASETYIIVIRLWGCMAFQNSENLAYRHFITCVTPGTPVNITATPGLTSATLSWNPGTPAGVPEISYEWEVETTGGVFVTSGITTDTSTVATGLDCGSTYRFRVFAETSCDGTSSPWSAYSANFTTTILDAPTNATATPSQICMGQSSDLSAMSSTNSIGWYTQSTGGTEIGTTSFGTFLTVSPVTTTTYWAEARTTDPFSNQLTTNLLSNNGHSGVFFDIEGISSHDIAIKALDINTASTGAYDAHVYYRFGTCVNNTATSNGWNYIGLHNVTAAGSNNPTYVELNSAIIVPAGQTIALYVSGIDFNYIDGTSLGATWYADDFLDIKQGYGTGLINSFGGALFQPRCFSGAIYYENANYSQYYVGPVDPTFGTYDSQNFNVQSNIFDVLHPDGVIIETVDIFFTAPIGSNFTMTLTNNLNIVLETYNGQVTVTGGPAQIVPIHFSVPAGTGYKLNFSLNPGSMRNDGGAVYPYTVPGIISITGNTWNPSFYYWFYNWKVLTINYTPPCYSSRTPVTVTVNDIPAQPSAIVGNPTPCVGSNVTYSVTDVPGTSYNWTFPAGWTQTGGGTTHSVTVDVGTGSGVITVEPFNSCGTGSMSTLTPVVPVDVVTTTFTQLGPYCEGEIPDALSLSSLESVSGTWIPDTITTNTPGTFDFFFTPDAGQCADPATMQVIVNANPTVTILGLDTFYCDYNPIATMTGTPAGGVFSGPGVSGSQFDPSVAGLGTHSISYIYVDPNNCTGSDVIQVEVDACSFINSYDNGNIQVYPNPVYDVLTVEIYSEEHGLNIWNLYDASGKLVLYGEQTLSAGDNFLQINTQNLANGLYMIQTNINGNSYSTRIIKQ